MTVGLFITYPQEVTGLSLWSRTCPWRPVCCLIPAGDLAGEGCAWLLCRELVQCAAARSGFRAVSEAASSAAHIQVVAQDHVVFGGR